MPIYGMSVEKQTLFRGVQQPFANVYYFDLPSVAPTSDVTLGNLLTELVDMEKSIHASSVTFTRGRVWNTGSGSQQGNQMRVDRTLTGAGVLTEVQSIDKERAYLVQWPAGVNVKGRPVYLRKWYHTCANPPGQSIANTVLQNTSQLTTAQREAISNIVNQIRTIEEATVQIGELCAKSGRPTTGNAVTHRYLEHHQLGDQWR